MSGRRIIGLFAPLLLVCLCAGIVLAQSTPAIRRWVIGSGGCTAAAGGNISLSSALGQPIAGPSGGDNVRILAGFWSGVAPGDIRIIRFAYLPVALRSYVYTWEDCGNSRETNACWIGGCGAGLRAYPDDTDDWYAFDLGAVRTLTVRATNVLPQTQLVLLNSAGQVLVNDGSSSSTKTVSYSLQRGFVRVYTPSGHNTTALYTLTLNCP